MEKYYNKVRPSSSQLGFSSPNVSFDIELVADPGLRKSIDKNMVNIENVRRVYLQKSHCQPKNHDFPWRDYGTMKRRFIPSWFNDHYNKLEYNISKDVFCLFCFLFKADHGDQTGGDAFVGERFRN